MDQPLTQQEGNFGTSTEYGPRLEYSQKRYRDKCWGIAYYIHILVIIIIGAYFYLHEFDQINNSNDNNNNNNDNTKSTLNLTGIFVSLIACAAAGTIFGLFWLQILKTFASVIIKTMLFLNLFVWAAFAIIGVIAGVLAMVVIGIIFFLIYALYTWCIWRRIPFASALLSISSGIVQTYEGTIYISIIAVIFNIIWLFIWGATFFAYITVSENKDNTNSFIIFLFLISYYWGIQVNKNISHTTTCGVAATWYFSTAIEKYPTKSAFNRTMTTSFGSVCLGSLIVAFLQALRTILRNSRGNSYIKCIAMCLLAIIERLIRYFNQYAFAQCAIYGSSFVEAAKATWNLFSKRGVLAIINDNLTGMALMCGAFLAMIISGLIGYFVSYAYYHNDDDWKDLPIAVCIFGGIIGYVLCLCILYVVHSAIICLFVCFAEDPAALANNRPEEYNRLAEVKPEMAEVYRNFGNNQSNQSNQTQQY